MCRIPTQEQFQTRTPKINKKKPNQSVRSVYVEHIRTYNLTQSGSNKMYVQHV